MVYPRTENPVPNLDTPSLGVHFWYSPDHRKNRLNGTIFAWVRLYYSLYYSGIILA
jgi:hypothetical protein